MAKFLLTDVDLMDSGPYAFHLL